MRGERIRTVLAYALTLFNAWVWMMVAQRLLGH